MKIAPRTLPTPKYPTGGKLAWPPPQLSSPTTLEIGTCGVYSLASGKDYILKLSQQRALDGWDGITVSGGNNVVIIGGEINMPKRWSSSRPALPTGFPGATISLTGTVTGGTFTLTHREETTAPITYNATGPEIQAALETLANITPGDCTVTGGAGGPWSYLPAFPRPEIGILSASSSLIGGVVSLSRASWTNMRALDLYNQTGTIHIEGLWIHGAGCAEGVNFHSPLGSINTAVQIQNCLIDIEADDFYRDHHHPDALQIYDGPQVVRTDRATLRCKVQAMLGQPNNANHYPNPATWEFRRTEFNVIGNKPNYSIIKDHSATRYPIPSSWQWNFTDCFTYGDNLNTAQYYNSSYNDPQPSGLTYGPPPSQIVDPARGDCGRGYVSPGYL